MEIARNKIRKTLQEKLELACEGARQLLHLLEVVEDGGQARQLAQVGGDQRLSSEVFAVVIFVQD